MDSVAFISGMRKVTGRWCKQRKREERQQSAQMNRRYVMTRQRGMTLKEAAWQVMEGAYRKASSNGKLPAHARQIMYAARGEILRLTEKDQLNDQYFTQTLLPAYIADHPDAQAWDVVYDARGHFAEPHDKAVTPLGTLGVRGYLSQVRHHKVAHPDVTGEKAGRYPTLGPRNRFGAVLFCEKEGFLPLFAEVKLAERFDLAIMSTKGVSNVASRRLIDALCGAYKIPLFVLHDFDVDGFKILQTLRSSTPRYQFSHHVEVIDLGLRLFDVEENHLESEPVHHSRDVQSMLTKYGVTGSEAAFLAGERVELNAFGSAELIEWIEAKLNKYGVKKVVPDRTVQVQAYRRAIEVLHLERVVKRATVGAQRKAGRADVPEDLDSSIRARLEDDPSLTWDEAVAQIAGGDDAR